MSILKAKIAKVAELKRESQPAKKDQPKEVVDKKEEVQEIDARPKRQTKQTKPYSDSLALTRQGTTSRKNIVKNYSQAMTSFALSSIASKYLNSMLQNKGLEIEDFRDFVGSFKDKANCIKGLRALLLVEKTDNEKIVCFKDLFKKVCIIFLKFYSVNWIFHSKVADKIAHLSNRLKILRRIQNPLYFTYMEGFSN